MTMEQRPTKRSVVILGATSTVAREIARRCAADGFDLVLAAVEEDQLDEIAQDLRVRSEVEVATLPFDATAFDTHPAFFEECGTALGRLPGGVILCFGYMAEQERAQSDWATSKLTIDINFTGAVSILNLFADAYEQRRSGFIAAISSAAGDRGRQSNYLYGCAKAGLTRYLEGLRNRLYHSNVQVTTVKPGFMDTKMTRGLSLPKPLVASPEVAADAIWTAIKRGQDEVYVLWFWRFIMLLVRHVPETLFKRLKM
jgi:decaprenylphospho-beta-D-erythro-pentofuranosid-2-ulose 2-reductase